MVKNQNFPGGEYPRPPYMECAIHVIFSGGKNWVKQLKGDSVQSLLGPHIIYFPRAPSHISVPLGSTNCASGESVFSCGDPGPLRGGGAGADLGGCRRCSCTTFSF